MSHDKESSIAKICEGDFQRLCGNHISRHQRQGRVRTEGEGEAQKAGGRDVVQALQRVHVEPLAVDEDLHQRQPRRLHSHASEAAQY